MHYFCKMKGLKIILEFYLNASIHVALAVFAFLRITEIYFELPFNQNLDYFIFFGTITGYNFVKYAGVAKLHHRSLTSSLKVIQVFSLGCFLIMCYYATQIKLRTLIVSIPFNILTVLYAVPFLSGFGKNLRQISYLKIIIVAFVWAGFTVLLPLVDARLSLNVSAVILFIQRFLLVVVLILPFDIRDVKYDAISLQTIPKKIGLVQTKRLGLLLLILALILEYLFESSATLNTLFMLFFFMVVLFLMRSKIEQSKYYSSFYVEALPIIWWLFILGFLNF